MFWMANSHAELYFRSTHEPVVDAVLNRLPQRFASSTSPNSNGCEQPHLAWMKLEVEDNSNQPDGPSDKDVAQPRTDDHSISLREPVSAFTADGNPEAHALMTWLDSHGIQSHVVEDNSGVSLFAFGTLSQFHKPQVYVDKSDLEKATELVRQFEGQRDQRRAASDDAAPIDSECEECGVISQFPATQDGTTQTCPECHAFMDVGTLDWAEDFDFEGTDELEPAAPESAEDAIDNATHLDKAGDWTAAIQAFQLVAERWPEHATYAANCIAEIERKIAQS